MRELEADRDKLTRITHAAACRLLVNEGSCIVVSVDYALGSRVAVGGDSAGGSLATQVCLAARDRRALGIIFQLLIYPGLDFDFTRPSCIKYSDGYMLTVPVMNRFLKHYVERLEDADIPYVCPLRARTLAGLPPALILVAEYDTVRDEGIELHAGFRAMASL
jgi:acetyl esterase/lipase